MLNNLGFIVWGGTRFFLAGMRCLLKTITLY